MPLPKLFNDDLELLSNNLQNIYVSAHDTKNSAVALIPSIFGNRLYCPAVHWRGRVLCFFYACMTYFVGDSVIKKKLEAALKATQRCFLDLEEFRQSYHDTVYHDYLCNRIKNIGSRVSPEVINNARGQIQKFFLATYPLTKLVHNRKNAKLNQFFETHYGKGTTPFYCPSTFKTVKGYVRIMALEGFAEGELPLSLFSKITEERSKEQIPNDINSNEEILIAFVKKMKEAKKNGNFQIKKFHSAMKSITCLLEPYQKQSGSDLKLLAKVLLNEDYMVLQEFDEEYVEWRQKLRKGDLKVDNHEPFYFLNDQGNKFIFALGAAVNKREEPNDHYKIYEIQHPETSKKYDNYLMIVGPNKICLRYGHSIRSKSFWGLSTPQVQYIHPKGRYAIVEKLPVPIDSIQWKSHSLSILDAADRQYADPLQKLIQFFVEERNSPKNFKAEYLRFDRKGSLKSIKACIPCGHMDYLALEEMAFQLAHRENRAVYQHIIQPLKNDDFCQKQLLPFFQKVVSGVFENQYGLIERLANVHKIKDKALIDRAKELLRFANQIKADCFEPICELYPSTDKKEVREYISRYLESALDKTFGRFWNNINSAELIAEIEKELNKKFTTEKAAKITTKKNE